MRYNLGELGFLNQIEIHQMQSHIKRIVQGDYKIEKRGHLYAYIDRNDGNEEELVPIINEIVITRAEPAKWHEFICLLIINILKCIHLMV